MLARLKYDEDGKNFRELSAAYAVSSWSSPLSRKAPKLPGESPWWWRGEEDASDSFLASMGVHLD